MNVTEKEGFLTVSADSTAPLVANIKAGNQTMVIDESVVVTGHKTGPDPYDYILSALGACTVITLHMYAQRKGWPLERAEVSLWHERIHPNDCLNCEDKNTKLSQVTKRLRLYGNLTAEQRIRLEGISSKCPVQKTLEGGITINTILEV
ncbi:OsmC family protein [Pontibacter sp. 172403-2]|uniref:OsmC family protein n=1 Tax=Pontibacter rufus TaxID=2791028 RepID=UPI0018B014A1|nr:OsmC family protein [Pontibacter sp. 172403-2]MBF9254320.1 OsmC family protein [Pontibacter sp. 172403-2]